MAWLDLIGFLTTGVLAGLLAGLFGVGGGVIVVPALILIFGHLGIGGDWVAHLAVGSSLAAIVGTGAASAAAHHRRGGVRWDLVARLAPGIVLGAWAGAALAGHLPEPWLRRVFALFLVYVGVTMLARARGGESRPLPDAMGLAAMGGVIGAVSALVGIGGGTLTVPYLSARALSLRQAVGTSAACGIPIALAGAVGFVTVGWGREGLPDWSSGFVYWPAVGLILLASVPSAPWGARLAHRLPVDTLRRAFAGLLLVMAAYLGLG
jgi:uncharacterized membrane protein YfcA